MVTNEEMPFLQVLIYLYRYCKSIGGVYGKAEIYWKNKDDENAYILFMRCFNTYNAIIKCYEFSKAKVIIEFLFNIELQRVPIGLSRLSNKQ